MTMPHADPTALAVERDRVIARLTHHFAHDELSIEELDDRIERAYRARSLEELAALTVGVPPAPVGAPAGLPAAGAAAGPLVHHEEHGRLLSMLSTMKRAGPWVVPRNLELASIMSETRIDLREARLAPGVTDIGVFAFMTQVVITVLPGVRVVDHTSPFMAETRNETLDDPAAPTSECIVRVKGPVIMSELVVRALNPGEKPGRKRKR